MRNGLQDVRPKLIAVHGSAYQSRLCPRHVKASMSGHFYVRSDVCCTLSRGCGRSSRGYFDVLD